MKTLLERAIEAGLTISDEPVVLPELIKELHDLCFEHTACAAQFRGWLIGNDIPFAEELDEDGVDFILDEYPKFAFNFEDLNDGEFLAMTIWD